MKNIGIVRKLDPLGRIVLPKELRKTLKLEEKDPMEIFVEGDLVLLKKYEPACVFCGDAANVKNFRGKNVCHKCAKELGRK